MAAPALVLAGASVGCVADSDRPSGPGGGTMDRDGSALGDGGGNDGAVLRDAATEAGLGLDGGVGRNGGDGGDGGGPDASGDPFSDGGVGFGDGGVRRCGGEIGTFCGGGEVCVFADRACGASGNPYGECRPRDESCALGFGVVCGCDGLEFGSVCEASLSGTDIANRGECRVASDCRTDGCSEDRVCSECGLKAPFTYECIAFGSSCGISR